jgi:hypothetical protein
LSVATTNLTPSEREQRARIAAHESWAATSDRTARTQPGRDAIRARFEQQVDPDGKLDPAERAKRATSAHRAHMARLAFESAKARRRRKAAGKASAS